MSTSPETQAECDLGFIETGHNLMTFRTFCFAFTTIFIVALSHAAIGFAQEARIEIDAGKTLHRVSKMLTGACIEDVNHEIYGGIYSQMIFGESFQEPPVSTIAGFKAYGGQWTILDGALQYRGKPGDKLVSELPGFRDGEIGVDVFLPEGQSWNAGLICRVARPGDGADNFDGYEISLNVRDQRLLLGRHRHNWEPIGESPCELPVGKWASLVVKLEGRTIECFVNGRSIVRHQEDDRVLSAGTIGLRAYQNEARFRDLWIKTDGKKQSIPLVAESEAIGEVSGMWRATRAGNAKGTAQITNDHPFVGRQSQRMTFDSGEGETGIENRGLNRWGLHFKGGKPYEGIVWARANRSVELLVKLESGDGTRTLAEAKLIVDGDEWQRLSFELIPKETQSSARLTLALAKPGTVDLGYAFLQPGEWGRFKGLPIRRDVTEGLIDQGVTTLRFGGSMINHPGYRWKKMIGPRDRRQPNAGTWYAYSTNGWGILDFLDLCEAAGFASIPAFNMDETPQDMGDFIEYVNGPATSDWGGQRALAGHPQPYGLKYIQLGNEERIDDTYFAKFKSLAVEIWKRDPTITIVVGDFVYDQPFTDPLQITGAASGIKTLAGQQKILQLAKAHQREVWFDIHIDTDGPRPRFGGMFSYLDALEKLAEGAKHRVVIFEFNSGNHSQRRALANAAAINTIERDGRIPIALAANCLQPDGQNDNGWNQGLLFLNPAHVWLQPPGYVTQMFSRAYQPLAVRCDVKEGGEGFEVSVKRSDDGKTLVLQVVNPNDTAKSSWIKLTGFTPRVPKASIITLQGQLNAANTADQPGMIIPSQQDWPHGFANGVMQYVFPPRSATVMRFD
jgi:hypothetical protein